ncbi:hypothetical protein PENFLA_c009G01037 [Penicillium flavigenum]|uniref:Uncharacterized protein n=1 Tax=Penicillium flavigenum TaxID=254877 RepID=A0A1V6TGD9_9EURO|nr:hypothetical protein PENFLA_c009G01037 [Penicillium flavigenum]
MNGLKQLQQVSSTTAPNSYQDKKRDTCIVPGGYIDHLVWEKVPEDSMDTKKFWELLERSRTDIRSKLKALFRAHWVSLVVVARDTLCGAKYDSQNNYVRGCAHSASSTAAGVFWQAVPSPPKWDGIGISSGNRAG